MKNNPKSIMEKWENNTVNTIFLIVGIPQCYRPRIVLKDLADRHTINVETLGSSNGNPLSYYSLCLQGGLQQLVDAFSYLSALKIEILY